MLTKNCVKCGAEQILRGVTLTGLREWKAGALIQEALPNTDANTREMLQTGICPECWNKMFPPEDPLVDPEPDYPPLDEEPEIPDPDDEYDRWRDEAVDRGWDLEQ